MYKAQYTKQAYHDVKIVTIVPAHSRAFARHENACSPPSSLMVCGDNQVLLTLNARESRT